MLKYSAVPYFSNFRGHRIVRVVVVVVDPLGVVVVTVILVAGVFVTGTGVSALTGELGSGGRTTIAAASFSTDLNCSEPFVASASCSATLGTGFFSSFFQTEHPPETQRDVHFSFEYGFDTPICVVVVSVCSTVRLEFPHPHNTTTPSKARNRFMDCPPTSPAQDRPHIGIGYLQPEMKSEEIRGIVSSENSSCQQFVTAATVADIPAV